MSVSFQHGYAVIIGAGADLPITINDAEAASKFLSDPNRCAFPHNQVRLLVSEDANRNNVIAMLESLKEQTKYDVDATVIVYFSGHGIYLPEFHILPYGYDLHNLAKTAISGDELLSLTRRITSKKLLLILDCCHSGAIDNLGLPDSIEKGPPPPELLDALKEGHGRIIISSSRKDEKSLIFKGYENSVFTLAFLEALAGFSTAEKDGYVRISDMISYISRSVPNRTQGRQNPVFKFQGLDNFILAYYSGGDTEKKSVEWLSAPTPQMDSIPVSKAACDSWKRQLEKRRENLLLIEERLSDFVLFSDIPLLLIKEKRKTENAIVELESKLLSCV